MEKNVLILSDFVGYGNVAMATSRAVLTRMGCTVYCLPTALISNTWNFGRCAVLNTTEYLRSSLETWDALGFRLDAVLIGYLADEEQARWVAGQCARWKKAGVKVLLDPIFADNGKLYRGIDEERIRFLRGMLDAVDYVLPNSTEACFLADAAEPEQALDLLKEKHPCAVAVTGVPTGEDNAVLLWDGMKKHRLCYKPVAGNYSGAGDAFTALFLGGVLAGKTAAESAENAIAVTKQWILRSLEENWQGMGLPVERWLHENLCN